MPTYEYQREDGTTFEMLQGINEDPLETCPETGQKVKRLISGGTGLVFKGSGFYITDYKKKNNSGNGSNGNGQSSSAKSSEASGNSNSSSNSDSTSKSGSSSTSGSSAKSDS